MYSQYKSTFAKSFLSVCLLTSTGISQAEENSSSTFNYDTSSINYANGNAKSSGGGGLGLNNPYYIGGSIGQTTASSYCNGTSGCEDNDSAWKIFGGYQIIDKVSVEGAYLNIGDIRKSGQNSDISAFAVYGVGTLPVTERFDAFAKIGAARWNSDNTTGGEDGFSMAYGIGAKMTLNETTKLRGEWEKILDVDTSNTEESDISILSIGVEFSTL